MVKYWRNSRQTQCTWEKIELWNLLRLTSYSHHSKFNTKGTLQTYNTDDDIVQSNQPQKKLDFLNFLDRNDNKKVKRTEHIAQEKFLASEKWEQYSNSQLLTLLPVGQVYLPFIKSSLSKTTLSWNISLILAYLAIYYWTIPLNVGNLRQNTKELSELLFPVPTRI